MISESIERIDPYTPEDVRTRTTSRGDEYTLIFSDEFDTPERIFAKGMDPFMLWSTPSFTSLFS